MPRGGHRENAGRKSEWISSSQTRPIRVPEWMADEILELARKLDSGATLDIVHNQKSDNRLAEITTIIERYKVIAKASRDWTKCNQLIQELEGEIASSSSIS